MSLYGIGIDVYIIVGAELLGALGIVAWAIKKSSKEEEQTSLQGSNHG